MKPNTVMNKVEGSLGGTSIAMEIDSSSIAHIMSVLTELYSDPALAVVREYSVNARDSHIEAGQTRPVEISTPTALSRYFKVKDYGVGLSIDELTHMYSKYGASSKRGTDTQAGMLGLGSKSGLAYTNQFSIISIKNGVKATVSVRRIENGTGVLEIVDTVSTTESNGVEIVIPVRNNSDFDQRVSEFFRFWDPAHVLINGKPPVSILEGATQVTPDIWIKPVDRWSDTKDIVVMGSVPYPIKSRFNNNFQMIANVPVGSLNFTPSREELHYTDLTNKTVKDLGDTLNAALIKTGQDLIDNAPNAYQAVIEYNKFNKTYGIKTGFIYQGMDMTTRERVDYIQFSPNASKNSIRDYSTLAPGEDLTNVVFITNFPYTIISAHRKAKIRSWINSVRPGSRTAIFYVNIFAGVPDSAVWINPDWVVDWSVVDKIDLSLTYAAKKIGPAPYPVCRKTGGIKDQDNLTGDILYFSPADMRDRGKDDWNYIGTYFPNHTIVQLGKNRWDKFIRDYPNAITLNSYISTKEAIVTKALTTEDIQSENVPSAFKELAKRLDITKIDDPELVVALTAVKTSDTLTAWKQFSDQKLAVLGFNARFPALPVGKDIFKPLIKRYAMYFEAARYGNSFQDRHITIYVNAIYATLKESK